MNQAILDYLKNKNALINLIVTKNNTNFLELQNNLEREIKIQENSVVNDKTQNFDFDSDEEDFDLEKDIIGSCKFSLNEILTDPDFANRVLDIISNKNSNLNLGYINFDFKLENSASVEGRIGKTKIDKINKKVFIYILYLFRMNRII